MTTGIVPDYFKTAVLKPSLKKYNDDPNELANYRPISNLPFLSKLLEKVVCQRITEHLTSNNLLSPSQSAYRKNHSTETSLVRVTNDILMALESGRSTVLVTIDISAAFDTVNHQMLLTRYKNHFGLKDLVLNWMSSYIANRKQVVQVNGHQSKPFHVETGFAQGSVLGGLKYSMFTTPLNDVITKHAVENQCFADDTNLYVAFDLKNDSNVQDQINKLALCLEDVSRWMLQNRLKLLTPQRQKSFFFDHQDLDLQLIMCSYSLKGT